MITITETIPDSIPGWAKDAMIEGQLWDTVFKRLNEVESNRDFWRKAYINQDRINEEWVEKHLILVKNLLETEEEKSLEAHLFDLYNQVRELKRLGRSGMCPVRRIDRGIQ